MPSEKLAGLMAAAILSDTVLFKSPTCTPRDKRMAERLARIAGIDLQTLGREMFSAGISTDKPAAELLRTDFLDTEDMLGRLEEFLAAMRELKALRGYDMLLLMLTDVLRSGTELLYLGEEETISQAFNTPETGTHHVFLPGVVSRKKQIIPALAALWG